MEITEQYYKLKHFLDRMSCTAYERSEMQTISANLAKKVQTLTNEVEELKKANKRLEEKIDE